MSCFYLSCTCCTVLWPFKDKKAIASVLCCLRIGHEREAVRLAVRRSNPQESPLIVKKMDWLIDSCSLHRPTQEKQMRRVDTIETVTIINMNSQRSNQPPHCVELINYFEIQNTFGMKMSARNAKVLETLQGLKST